MSRGLSAGEITNLASTEYRVEELVEIYLADNSWYYTTGDYASTITTPTAGSQTRNPRSFIAEIGSVKETFEATPNTLDLQFQRMTVGGADDTFTNNLGLDVINRRVVLYKLFRDLSSFTPDTSDGLIQIFDGVISGLEIETSLETRSYTIRCTSDFGDYDKVRGRSTANIFGAMQGKTVYWGSFYLE